MDRRQLLAGAAATFLGAVQGVRAAQLAVPGTGPAFRDLPEQTSVDGLLKTTLDMGPKTFRIGGQTLRLDCYNGQPPGATIYRLKPGDTLQWTLRNQMKTMGLPLGQKTPTQQQQSLDHTNVHTHGLQVSPRDGADNVYQVIKPGEEHTYTYSIPGPDTGRPQPAGMHWYHPHKHGSTSHQGWQGLAGPLIVEGDIDRVPEVAAAKERVMVLNELFLNSRGETPTAPIVPTAGPVPFTSVPSMPTHMMFPINGVLQPQISIRPGETQRWRVLAAGPHRFFHLQVDGHELWQISQDGIPFETARRVDRILMAPGNRVEFIIRGGRPGRYGFRALAYDQGHPGGPRPELMLGTLVSSGAEVDGKLPGRLVEAPRIPEEAAQPVNQRTVWFKGNIATNPVQFYLDGKAFSAQRIDQAVLVGTTEDWILVNEDVFQHPFHIHVNPFQVIEINGTPTNDHTWWDTFALPSKGSVKIRQYFRPDITGLTVYHCHILPHEDNGMMANVLLYGDFPQGFGPAPDGHH